MTWIVNYPSISSQDWESNSFQIHVFLVFLPESISTRRIRVSSPPINAIAVVLHFSHTQHNASLVSNLHSLHQINQSNPKSSFKTNSPESTFRKKTMAAALLGGAALETALGELLTSVVRVAKKAANFKSVLSSVESMLERISPVIEEIKNLNRVLDRSEEETKMLIDQLKEADKLVRKCEKVHSWNYFKKVLYEHKLRGLEDSLVKFFGIEVQAQQWKDGKKILVKLNEVDAKLDGKRAIGGFNFVGWCGVPGIPDFVVGFEEPLRELKMKILKGGEQVVVLSAPGGCGKTTMTKLLCHDEEVKGIFRDNIFFVTFSKAPNIKVIVDKLFQHKGYTVPEFQTDEEAINQLEHMLKQIQPNPILLVLDDLWPGSESLIEKLQFRIAKYKILVTSRSVFPRFSTYKLKLLKDQDAKTLFHHSAFPQCGNSGIPDDLVNKIVSGCGGFPLALKVVGRSLCGQPEVMWKRRLKQWSEGHSIFYSNDDLLICLQSSLVALDEMDTLKECYLDLAAFPEDQRIPVTALMDMWVELHNLDEDGEDAMANLYELFNRSLVNLVLPKKDASESSGYYNEYFVTQHDLLRELAIHQSALNPIEQRNRLVMDIRGNDFPRWWIERRQHPTSARLVSISTDENFSSNWYNIELPKVEVLMLNVRARSYTLPHFMEKLDQLKVLIITNYGFCSTEINNFPLLKHLSGLKRIRLEYISISSNIRSILQLKNLQKISLVMCKIDDAFRNCTIHIPDMLPNLVEIGIDYCNDLVEFPEWLCSISCLQKLNITNCHELTALPEGIGKLENLEVLRLHACTKLLELPESIGSLWKLCLLDLSDCISMIKLPARMGELCGLRKLHMRGCQGLSELPASVNDLKQLKDLICDEEIAYLWEPYKIHLTNLKINLLEEDISLDWLQR